jgi:hypothetical protein
MDVKEEQRGLRVFENRLLRKIFVPVREEVTGGFGRLCNDTSVGVLIIV